MGSEDNAVEEQIEGEDLAIERLERIVGLVELGARGRVGRRRRAGAERQHQEREKSGRNLPTVGHGAQHHLLGVTHFHRQPPGRGMVDNAAAECNSNLVAAHGATETPNMYHDILIAVAWLLCIASAAGSVYLLCAGFVTRRFAARTQPRAAERRR